VDECHVDIADVCPTPCVVPDNGTGTVTLPPMGCEFMSPDEMFEIIDGLPAGTTIEMPGILKDFICDQSGGGCSLPLPTNECEMQGGSLGGHGHCFEATLELDVYGTGQLDGFHRSLAVPVFCEVHTGPRNPGDPVQAFDADMYRLQGELFGDPDFCTFRITGGTDFGLPSPGQTILTELPSGDFAVDSFFDITYQIEFEGCPGGPLEDYMGTTTATLRMQTGCSAYTPACIGDCPAGFDCERVEIVNPDGTIDISCDCVAVTVIKAGPDYWVTTEAEMDFISEPIPADFFEPGSDPFDWIIYMKSNPIAPSSYLADTIVERTEDAILSDTLPVSSDTIDVELAALNLVSSEPITVTSNGGTNPKLYDVSLGLDTVTPSTGQMTITKTHANGGTFDFSINSSVEFTFTEQGGAPTVFTLVKPLTIATTEMYPWQNTPPILMVRPPCIDSDFYPSGMDPLRLNPGALAGFHYITHKDPLPMDFDKDGDVDLVDYSIFTTKWLYGK
jgi:hypothetical protein